MRISFYNKNEIITELTSVTFIARTAPACSLSILIRPSRKEKCEKYQTIALATVHSDAEEDAPQSHFASQETCFVFVWMFFSLLSIRYRIDIAIIFSLLWIHRTEVTQDAFCAIF